VVDLGKEEGNVQAEQSRRMESSCTAVALEKTLEALWLALWLPRLRPPRKMLSFGFGLAALEALSLFRSYRRDAGATVVWRRHIYCYLSAIQNRDESNDLPYIVSRQKHSKLSVSVTLVAGPLLHHSTNISNITRLQLWLGSRTYHAKVTNAINHDTRLTVTDPPVNFCLASGLQAQAGIFFLVVLDLRSKVAWLRFGLGFDHDNIFPPVSV
jgi:hypothetical protein